MGHTEKTNSRGTRDIQPLSTACTREGPITECNPTLIVVAGPNGSGKTSLTTEVLQHAWVEGCNYINPDNIARDIYGDWNSDAAVMAAARHAENER